MLAVLLGTGGEAQHAHSLFASAGLVRADDVGQINGHEAYYQSHSVLGHEFVDKSHVIVGATHDAPAHASPNVPLSLPQNSDHGMHGAASPETALHTAAGHHASQQVCLLRNRL